MTPDQLSVSVRAVALAFALQASGAAFFLALFGRRLIHGRGPVQRLGCTSALVGLVVVLAHLTLDGARLSGDYDGMWDWDLQRLAWNSKSGLSQLVQAAGLLVIHLTLRRRGRSESPVRFMWAAVAGAVVCAGFLLTGHTSHHRLRAVLAPSLALHVLILAFWFGSLLPLILVTRLESRETVVDLFGRFSSLAAWLVPLLLVAGLVMAAILTGSFEILRRPYGELLLAKLSGFGLLMVFAGLNKWRLTPALAAGGPGGPLRWSIAVEYALIVAVLSVTAVLTTFYSPD